MISWLLAGLLALGQGPDSPARRFFCPMHPDVVAAAPGACKRCDMALIEGDPLEPRDYRLDLETRPRPARAGRPVELRFHVFHPGTGAAVTEFEIVHEQPYHLFVVSQDLEHFFHLHPDVRANGTVAVELTLPQEGYYKVYSDFLPRGGTPQVIARALVTAGARSDLASSGARLTPDPLLEKAADGLAVELVLDPRELVAGREGRLRYRLTDERTGEPVRDLRPYLAAWGHTLVLSEDLLDQLHSHPVENLPEGLERETARGGPEVTFDVFFPRPARYRIWSQFLRGERLTTLYFDVEVYRLGAEPSRLRR